MDSGNDIETEKQLNFSILFKPVVEQSADVDKIAVGGGRFPTSLIAYIVLGVLVFQLIPEVDFKRPCEGIALQGGVVDIESQFEAVLFESGSPFIFTAEGIGSRDIDSFRSGAQVMHISISGIGGGWGKVGLQTRESIQIQSYLVLVG